VRRAGCSRPGYRTVAAAAAGADAWDDTRASSLENRADSTGSLLRTAAAAADLDLCDAAKTTDTNKASWNILELEVCMGMGKTGIPWVPYDTRCYFNVRLKANMSQPNLPHGTDN